MEVSVAGLADSPRPGDAKDGIKDGGIVFPSVSR
jgi:hypothetical protein